MLPQQIPFCFFPRNIFMGTGIYGLLYSGEYIYKSDQCVYVLAFKWRFVGGGGRCSLCVVHLLHVTMVVVFIGDG